MLRVSRVLAAAGLTDGSRYTEASRERGRAVHAIAECVFQRQEVSVAPAYDGYARAIVGAVRALGFEAVCVERRLVSDGLTGRPDAIGWVGWRLGSGIHAGPAIVDIKSGGADPAHGLQLALYERLAEASDLRALLPPEHRDLPWNRIALYVAETGTYRIYPYTDPYDSYIAQAAWDLARWRVAHGLLAADDSAAQDDDPIFPLMEVQ